MCHLHGAGGGAPQGNKNAWKHEHYSAEAIEERKWIAATLKGRRQDIS